MTLYYVLDSEGSKVTDVCLNKKEAETAAEAVNGIAWKARI